MAKDPNERRVEKASAALEFYANIEGSMGEPSTDLIDLLTDLLHLSDSVGWDFDYLLETARDHCRAEAGR